MSFDKCIPHVTFPPQDIEHFYHPRKISFTSNPLSLTANTIVFKYLKIVFTNISFASSTASNSKTV